MTVVKVVKVKLFLPLVYIYDKKSLSVVSFRPRNEFSQLVIFHEMTRHNVCALASLLSKQFIVLLIA